MHDEVAHDTGHAVQHEVERDGRIGRDHALDRRVADVALVPQGDVLEGRHRIAAHQARQAGHVLREDRVALVRHRRRALLGLAEGLLRLADLGALQVADLDGEALDRPGDDGHGREELRVPVARHDLRGERFRHQAESLADVGLDLRRQVRERPDRARQLAEAHAVARRAQALDVALHLGRTSRPLQPEGDGLGVDAVRAPDHRRAAVVLGLNPEGVTQADRTGDQEVRRAHQLHGEGGVEHVGRGEPEVQEAAFRADARPPS